MTWSSANGLCYNGIHELPGGGKCPRCRRQTWFRERARYYGKPLCGNGHGLIGGNVTNAGGCAECRALGIVDHEATDTQPGETWLDWAAVHQAMQGLPLVRPLTNRELLCLAATVRSRDPEMGLGAVVSWIVDSTRATGITESYLEYLENRWAVNGRGVRDLARPVMTVNEAMLAEIDGTIDDLAPRAEHEKAS